jgi:Ca2+-binding RTX toxin-like protein
MRRLAALALLVLAAPPAAHPAVVTSVVGGELTARSDADDSIVVSCLGGFVKVNNVDPQTGVALCAAIGRISVHGGPLANTLDLGAVTSSAFPSLLAATIGDTAGRDDRITGRWVGDTLAGGPGGDFLDGRDGNDTLEAGEDAVRNELYGGDGDDRITGAESHDWLVGGPGSDTVFGRGGNDGVDGGDGDDVVEGGDGGDNYLTGGPGRDTLRGGAGEDGLKGEDGEDVLEGGDDNDLLLAGADADRVVGGAGSDSFEAGPGNDAVEARDGAQDAVSCGPDADTVVADADDGFLAGDCENIDRPAQPPPQPQPQPQPQPRPRQPVRCVVPNVRGRTVAQARGLLARGRCALGRVTRAYSARARPGRIV